MSGLGVCPSPPGRQHGDSLESLGWGWGLTAGRAEAAQAGWWQWLLDRGLGPGPGRGRGGRSLQPAPEEALGPADRGLSTAPEGEGGSPFV